MKAKVGDRLVIDGTNVGDRRRISVVTGVAHTDGPPPFVVRRISDGPESVVFPGPGSRVQTSESAGTRT
jgi:hypothetical protein